jgi:hypothetical protein
MEEITALKKQLQFTGEALCEAITEEKAQFERLRTERASLESEKHLLSEANQMLLNKHQDLLKWQKDFAAVSKRQRALELEKCSVSSRLQCLRNKLSIHRRVMESRRRREEVFFLSISRSIEMLILKFQKINTEAASLGDASLSLLQSDAIEDPGARAESFRAATKLLQQQRTHAENKEESYLRCEIQKKSSLLKTKRAERQNLESSAMQLNCVTPSPLLRQTIPPIDSSEIHRRGRRASNEENARASSARSLSAGVSLSLQAHSPSTFSYQRGNEWFRKRSYANTAAFTADDLDVGFDASRQSSSAATGEGTFGRDLQLGAGAERDASSSRRHTKSSRTDSFYVESSEWGNVD